MASKTTGAEPEILDLCDDDGDSSDTEIQLLATIPSVVIASKVSPRSVSTTSAVIDLCNNAAASTAAKRSASAAQTKRTTHGGSMKRRKRPPSVIARAADAICIDDDDPVMDVSPIASYRSRLGPLRMGFVDSFRQQHVFRKQPQQSGRKKTNKLCKELLEYKLNLPIELSSSIFVRVMESRLDIIRALIIGPEGTPYANGCFLFDVFLDDYPKMPPKVKFLTTGGGKVRFNPNLYNDGKVCLSLLGTWSGPGWQANKSTLLQVLISIQGLILVPDPFYNEPGYRPGHHKKESEKYTKNIRRHTLEHAINSCLLQAAAAQGDVSNRASYPEFTNVMVGHFCERADAINKQLEDWVREDRSLVPLANRVRKNLAHVVSKFSNRKGKVART